jgi:(heptosyl)LPS beta-1,4-glucosyltransferase
MANEPTIGVIAISKNEERDLPGFLSCLISWVDEIVIVDDGSTDRTVEIAQATGNTVRVIERKKELESGFAGQRNIGLQAAQSDWLLNMDIDERVTPELAQEIKLASSDAKLNAFRYRRLNYFLHRPMKAGGWSSWNNPQLARRGYHRYVNKVHERCVVDGAPDSVGQLKGVMWHLNDESYKERMAKSFQYCLLEAEKMIACKTRLTGFKIITLPLIEFIKKYVFKRGFLDGTPGLVAAMHSSCAMFRACALTWDEQNRIQRDTLERALREMWKKSLRGD